MESLGEMKREQCVKSKVVHFYILVQIQLDGLFWLCFMNDSVYKILYIMLICPLICIALKTHFKLVLLPDFEHRTVQHDVLVTLRYYIIIVIP